MPTVALVRADAMIHVDAIPSEMVVNLRCPLCGRLAIVEGGYTDLPFNGRHATNAHQLLMRLGGGAEYFLLCGWASANITEG
jgi:hypothetical protein